MARIPRRLVPLIVTALLVVTMFPTTALAAPAAPSGLSATILSATHVLLAWTDNSVDETGFRVERSTNGGAFALAGTTAANVTSMTDATVTAGNNYAYRLLATSAAGNSLPSNTASVAVTASLQVGANEPRSVWPGAPAGVATGYPAYYQDDQGTRVGLIPVAGDGINAPTQIFSPKDRGNPYSTFLGFDAEAFYWLATSIFDVAGNRARAVIGLEAAFASANGLAQAGQETVFMRVRIKTGVPVPGAYTVQHPYGTEPITVTAADITAGSTVQNPSHTYAAPGAYRVRQTVINANASSRAEQTIIVTP